MEPYMRYKYKHLDVVSSSGRIWTANKINTATSCFGVGGSVNMFGARGLPEYILN